MSILVISNHNSFRVLFDKIASVYFIWKKYLYFSTGNGQPREPGLCQLYRHTFVPFIGPIVEGMILQLTMFVCIYIQTSHRLGIQNCSKGMLLMFLACSCSSGCVLCCQFSCWKRNELTIKFKKKLHTWRPLKAGTKKTPAELETDVAICSMSETFSHKP